MHVWYVDNDTEHRQHHFYSLSGSKQWTDSLALALSLPLSRAYAVGNYCLWGIRWSMIYFVAWMVSYHLSKLTRLMTFHITMPFFVPSIRFGISLDSVYFVRSFGVIFFSWFLSSNFYDLPIQLYRIETQPLQFRKLMNIINVMKQINSKSISNKMPLLEITRYDVQCAAEVNDIITQWIT